MENKNWKWCLWYTKEKKKTKETPALFPFAMPAGKADGSLGKGSFKKKKKEEKRQMKWKTEGEKRK